LQYLRDFAVDLKQVEDAYIRVGFIINISLSFYSCDCKCLTVHCHVSQLLQLLLAAVTVYRNRNVIPVTCLSTSSSDCIVHCHMCHKFWPFVFGSKIMIVFKLY